MVDYAGQGKGSKDSGRFQVKDPDKLRRARHRAHLLDQSFRHIVQGKARTPTNVAGLGSVLLEKCSCTVVVPQGVVPQ
eukprot:scaffold310413_cov17-Tisochrysis_lutea.AAC.1